MGYEVTIICDECGSIIVAARTATKARKEGIRDKVMVRRDGKDICADCDRRTRRSTHGDN